MKHSPQMGIYSIVNRVDGRIYVGSTVNLATRRARHLRDLRNGRHDNIHLREAHAAHGANAFEFAVLEIVADTALLQEREGYWIQALHSADRDHGYNLMTIANRPVHSDETRQRMSAAHLAMVFTPEHRAKIAALARARNAALRGVPLSAEHKAKLRAVMLGRQHSTETRAKIGDANRGRPGKPATPDARQRMSAAGKGKPKSDAHKANIRAALTGKPHSAERRAKIAEAMRRRSAMKRGET